MQDIEKELKDITGLISLPEIYLKVRRLMDDETSSIDDFANVIIVDPNLSTRVLKLVNSAVFGLSEPVDSITRAINMIGIDQLHNMVLGASAMSSLDLPNEILPLRPFWHNSLYTGVLTQQFAQMLQLERSDRQFIAGLLHEIGHLVLCARFADHARETIMVSIQSSRPLHEIQQQLLGFHYGDIGAMLIANWNLPTELQVLIRHQPAPATAPAQRSAVALLHLAHAYAGQDIANNLVAAEDLVAAEVRAMIDLSQPQIEECLGVARSVSREIGNSILA
ncbi:MAG: HDOD domain-containing protein [Gammaproteobacteria bacterium]|nr:HDOD domain-containing protein [Gammaproteobacteria bacterium]MDH3448117.1 HDOD domain-containing protein [Gammaproteobacteria bacterium]